MRPIIRPTSKESEEDLIRQDQELCKEGENAVLAAKLIRKGKRKTNAALDEGKSKEESPESKIDSNVKKKKEGIVDSTILKEAVSMEAKTNVVLGQIVERNVPTFSPVLNKWNPIASPYGFPKASKFDLQKSKEEMKKESSLGKPRKSLYMRNLEKKLGVNMKNEGVDLMIVIQSDHEEKLAALDSQKYILSNATLDSQDVSKIHTENISKLATMSHDERLKERNNLMSGLSPEQIKFIQSLHLKKSLKEQPKDFIKECSSSNNQIHEDSEMDVTSILMEDENKSEKSVSFSREVSMDVSSHDSISNPPIDLDQAKKWVHMDKVEIDKLRWTSELPPVKPLRNTEGFIARFSFTGDILPYESDVSWREGLHHHGEEPERAGYTIDELFLFARSQVVQQRHVGLSTLANILRNAREGLYDVGLETSIIQLLIDAGLVLLLRFALDDSTALVYQEALRALYHLLSSPADEHCLGLLETWEPLGGVEPGISSLVHRREKDRSELDAEEKELKDFEILQLDVVRALIRMDTHLRLRYFIETIRPSPPDIIHILGIFGRIARHSLTAAWTLVSTPRLIKSIVDNFVPCNVSQLLTEENVLQMDTVYGVPLRHAVTFLKVLCSRGRQLATILISDHDIMSSILAYISMEPNNVGLPLQEALNLSQEAYGLWAKLLSYGLPKAEQSFSSFFPQLLRQLFFYRDKVDINEKHEENKFNYNIGAYMIHVATKALSIGAMREILVSKRGENEDEIVPPTLDWESFKEVSSLVEVCLVKWFSQLVREKVNMSFSAKRLLGNFCTFLNVYYRKWKDQSCFEGVEIVNTIEEIYSKAIAPFLMSASFEMVTEKLCEYSALVCNAKPGNSRDSVNLATLACVTFGGELTPIIQKDSPFALLLPFTYFVYTLHSLNPSLKIDSIEPFLNSSKIKSYLMNVLLSKKILSDQWLTRVEVYNLLYIVKLSSFKRCGDLPLFHKVALSLLPIIRRGDEHIVKDLLEIVCDSALVKDIFDVETQIDSLTMKDFKPLKSPALKQPILSTIQLTNILKNRLTAIGMHFFKAIIVDEIAQQCRIKLDCIYFLINNFTQDDSDQRHILHKYWTLIALNSLKPKKPDGNTQSSSHEQSTPEDILLATRCLQMTYMILKYRKESITHTESMGWIRYLSLIFLASNDLFLDVEVSSYLQACLIELLQDGMHAKINYRWEDPSLSKCIEWYKEMVEQYSSVSYGDSTFALFIVIPLLRKWPEEYKIALFGDLSESIPFIRLSCSDVQQFIPLQDFLMPSEDKEDVIIKYRSALGSRLVSEKRTPFLYYFTTHHINQYVKRKRELSVDGNL